MSQTVPEFMTVDGINVRYRMHRNPGKPKLLLTNSLPQSIRCRYTQWDDLSSAYELLAVDLPGFGLSGCRAGLLSPSAQGQFLAKTIEQCSWQGCIAVGPDIGVPVVLSLAQTRPELVSGIVLMDGPGYYEPVLSADLRWTMKYAWFRWIGAVTYSPKAYLNSVFKRAYRKAWPAPDAYAEFLQVNKDRAAFERTGTFLSTYPKELTLLGNGFASMKVPTLIAWGEGDVYVPVENAKELARRIPNNRLHIFKGCGHFSHEDAGREFFDVLQGWAATL